MGGQQFRETFPNTWGQLRVICILINGASVSALMVLLLAWNRDWNEALVSTRATYRIAAAICVANGTMFY
jgi:hypothetical protein